jgi:DNA topoisomerase-2
LAQNFVGANNLNLLEPSGQFGTRLAGGKDAASSRYIFTRLASHTRKIFDLTDGPVLKYVVDDGQQVEPEYYVPVLPMILVNGAEGIGTGFSCYVPPYDVAVIKHNIQCALDQVAMAPMVPHFKGFKGKVTKTKDHTWVLEGLVFGEGSRLHVTELPPGKWIQDFKEHLDDLVEKGTIQKYENHSTETSPDFHIWGASFTIEDAVKELGLTKTIHTSNMYLIGPNGAVKKYASPEEILVDYVEIRLGVYKKRKAWLLKEFDSEIEWLSEKARFITGVINGSLKVLNVPLAQVQTQLAKAQFKDEIWSKLMDTKTYQYVKEEVDKLHDLCVRKQTERTALKSKTVISMWKSDLVNIV